MENPNLGLRICCNIVRAHGNNNPTMFIPLGWLWISVMLLTCRVNSAEVTIESEADSQTLM